MKSTLRSRCAALAVMTALTAGLITATAPDAHAGTKSALTQQYCQGVSDCSVNVAQGTAVNEGTYVLAAVQARPNQTISLRPYLLESNSAGVPTKVTPAGAATTATTDATGTVTMEVRLGALPAGLSGGMKYIVQPSDVGAEQMGGGGLMTGPQGQAPGVFAIYSARANYVGTTDVDNGAAGWYHETVLNYAINGHRFAAEMRVNGVWRSMNTAWSDSGLVIGTVAHIRWNSDAVPSGVYTYRIRNVTTNAVVRENQYAIPGEPTGVWGDQDGDRRADLLAIDGTATLRTYVTRSGPSFMSPSWRVSEGWGAVNWMATTPDLDRNGYSELVVRRTDGTLWIHRGVNFGTYDRGVRVGTGWDGMSLLTVMPDTNRDGYPELLGRAADGRLLRYRLTLGGASLQATVGTGWGGMRTLLAVGDITKDGNPDLLAVRSDGTLWRYAFNARGVIVATKRVGHGWTSMQLAIVPGDMDGNGTRDMVARRADGLLFFYPLSTTGTIGTAKQIGSGWGGVRLLA